MRFYNLIQSKEVRDYLESGDRDPELDRQLRYIIRAYDTLDNKFKYLKEMEKWNPDDVRNLGLSSISVISDYYKKCLEEIYNEDNSTIKIFTIKTFDNGEFLFGNRNNHKIEEEFFNEFSNIHEAFDETLLSMNGITDEFCEDNGLEDFYIDCNIFDKDTKEKINEYEIFMIGSKISSIVKYTDRESEEDKSIKDISYDIHYYTDLVNRKDPYYPYENFTRVAIQTPIMRRPIEKYIVQDVDGNGTDYICLYNAPYESSWPENYIFIPGNRFQNFYNLYDWIKEVK